ncbi:MAG: VacJ family lipoprotein [Elusimicrobia bacterium]|nr:VacJ family lipoprotein [Elusimicrobiota bacterium]
MRNGSAARAALVSCLAVILAVGADAALAAEAGKRRKSSAPPMSTPAVPAGAEESGGPDADFEQFEGEFGKDKEGETKKVFDPLRGYNRAMFHFNDKFYLWVAKPMATFYGWIIPEPGRVALARAYMNLAFPVRFVGSGLQAKWAGAGAEFGRFLVNSTLGLGGFFDPAEAWFGWELVDEDIGQAFGRWGIGPGFPVVLPILGQSNLRDGVALAGQGYLSPLNPVYNLVEWDVYLAATAGGHFNYISLHLGEYEKVKKDALDPYTFIRDAHLQNREKRIKE